MSEIKKKEENVDGIQYYGFEDSDLFPGAKDNADKPLPGMHFDDDSTEFSDVETNLDKGLSNQEQADKPFITENDISELLKTEKPSPKKIKDESSARVSNLIKKEVANAKNVLSPTDFKKGIEKSTGINKHDWSEIAEDIEENDFLSDDFLDFVEFPKITGDHVNFVGKKLINSQHITDSKKTVEIADQTDLSDDEHHTSIEINRSENGDIESIAVYCKCGEVTQISFNYDTEQEIDTTEYFKINSGIEPLNLEQVNIKE